MSNSAIPQVYVAIAAVMADLSKEGIAKDKLNAGQKFKFRGIDDVYNALAPVLSKHGLCVLPRVLDRSSEERTTANGGRMNYVTVEVEFDLVASADGSRHTVKTFGEAMDNADKATNKAMSAAFKYAAFQAFCIPTEGDDADARTPVVQPVAHNAPWLASAPQTPTSQPEQPKSPPVLHPGSQFLKDIGLTVPELKAFKDKCAVLGMDWRDMAETAKNEDVNNFETLDLFIMAKLQEAGKSLRGSSETPLEGAELHAAASTVMSSNGKAK